MTNGKDRKHVLLVEDYPVIQRIVVKFLTAAGYYVDLAANGKQAVEAFGRTSYDLILMDVQMPEMDGYEAAERIRELEANQSQTECTKESAVPKRTPIIAMTGLGMNAETERYLAAGMDGLLEKPLRRESLISVVNKWTLINPGSADSPSPGRIGNEISKENRPMVFSDALVDFDGDESFLMEVMEGFLNNLEAQIVIIRGAFAEGNVEAVRREAHSIRGGAENVFANRLAGIASQLEYIGESGEVEVNEVNMEIVDVLESEYHLLKNYLRDR